MNGSPAIEAEGVRIAFGAHPLLVGLSLRVLPNEILGLIGPSGAGKSSVGKLLCGLLAPAAGSVWLQGRPLQEIAPHDLPVMSWQEALLFEHLDVAGNIALGLVIRQAPDEERRQCVERLLDAFALSGLRNNRPAHLSGGEKARVGLARALAVDPHILVLDEPFASLDVISRDRALHLVAQFVNRPNKAALLVSHIFADIAAACREVVVIEGPIVKPQITVQQLAEQPRSAFEAQFSGRWRVGGATIIANAGSVFSCLTGFGEAALEVAPWVAASDLAGARTAAVISRLTPAIEQNNDLASAAVKWLIPE